MFSSQRAWFAVGLIGVGQLIAWGSLYYAIAVVGQDIARDLNLSPATVFAAFSLALLVSGLAAPAVGRWIDKAGGRSILAISSVLASVAFALLAAAQGPIGLFIGWFVAGMAMACGLYDAAFATLSKMMGSAYRQALTLLTLVGGLASTVFWPLTQALASGYGWRGTFVFFALFHLLCCAPMHWFGVPRIDVLPASNTKASTSAPQQAGTLPDRTHNRSFIWLAGALAATQFIAGAVSAHALGLLVTGGISAASAVWLGALIGPTQVAGRLIEFSLASRISSLAFGALCFALLLAGMICFAFSGPSIGIALAAMLLYGWANGTVTIVRGTVPAELYGRAAYGALLGRLARPQLIARAMAPVVIALVLERFGATAALTLLVFVAAAAALAYWQALRLARLNVL
jgi:MFS family permease